MRLQTKFVMTTLIIVIISILFLGILVFSNSKTNIEKKTSDNLNSVSQAIEKSIDDFLFAQQKKIELIATQSELSNEELLQMTQIDSAFYDLFVIASNGTVIASSNPQRMGLDRANRSYFVNARNQSYINPVYYALVPKEYSISVSTPFHEGVLVGAMKISVLDDLIAQNVELGKTGESLMSFINEEGKVVYFTKRKFSEEIWQTIELSKTPFPMFYALNKKEMIIKDVKDYRGIEVLSVTNYIESIGVGLVSKIDSSEAFADVEKLKSTTFFLLSIILILISIVIYVLTKPISKEIIDLREDIDRITKGDLEIQLKKSSIFEIQNLIDSLNRILATMKLAILRTGLSKSEVGIGEAIKAKEEAENKYKRLYETSNDAIMTLEPPKWNFSAGNPATLKLFNLKDENQLATLTPGDLSPLKQPNGRLSEVMAKKMIEKAIKEGSAYFEWTHRKYKGENFLASVLLSRIEKEGKIYLQATVRDLSKFKDK
jgi:hypothetical protein